MSVKLCAGNVIAGVVLSTLALSAPTVNAGSLIVNNERSLAIQTPASPTTPAISYQTGAQTSTLSAYTQGYLFCANVSPPPPPGDPYSWSPAVTLAPKHEDQAFTPAHPWAMSSAIDILSVGYTGSLLSIGRIASAVVPSSLVCHGVDANGTIPNGIADRIFDSGVEPAATENYSHLINWLPPRGFDWGAPDWAQVPTDPCYSSPNQPQRTIEDAACAAAISVRPGTLAPSNRAGTLWTASDASSFTYLVRVDARYGPQPATSMPHFALPTIGSAADANEGVYAVLRDAYDSAFLGGGSYCFIGTETLPGTLNSHTCDGNPTRQTLSGPLAYAFQVAPQPVGPGATSFYVVVDRSIGQSAHANTTTPVVGVSILIDPALGAEGGDHFIGDDAAFGFMPGSPGFSWMAVQ
jgi:hypothetical protein